MNYAWTTEPFEAGGVFFGDYTGLAAFDGRVYGAWTEKPPPAPDAGEGKSMGNPPKRGTVVKVGVADFKASAGRGSP
jgi:hypothetical protein